jgi:hypothetical protein
MGFICGFKNTQDFLTRFELLIKTIFSRWANYGFQNTDSQTTNQMARTSSFVLFITWPRRAGFQPSPPHNQPFNAF